MESMESADQIIAKAIATFERRLPAEMCFTCVNANPGIKGFCFLHQVPKVDLGQAKHGEEALLGKVSETQPIEAEMIRDIACAAYNVAAAPGYPEGHPKRGGWQCVDCGFWLHGGHTGPDGDLLAESRVCSNCGASGSWLELEHGFYPV